VTIALKFQQIERANENSKRNKELQKAIVKTQIETTHDVLRKIRPQMHCIIASLCNDLEETCRAQKEKMIADFNRIVRYRVPSIALESNFQSSRCMN